MLDAVRDAATTWMFRDRGRAWAGVRYVAFSGSPSARHLVDVSDTMDDGVRSLEPHRLYLENLGDEDGAAAKWLRSSAADAGAQCGAAFAATFEVMG